MQRNVNIKAMFDVRCSEYDVMHNAIQMIRDFFNVVHQTSYFIHIFGA